MTEPYREPKPPEPEPPDQEHLAIGEIARRARRVRGVCVVASALIGVIATIALFDAFDAYYEARGLAMSVKGAAVTSAVLGFLPPLVLSPRVSDLLVRMLKPRWVAAIAKAQGLDVEVLTEMTASF
jgi:hypothetical protein